MSIKLKFYKNMKNRDKTELYVRNCFKLFLTLIMMDKAGG